MNRVNSSNILYHEDSTVNIVPCIISISTIMRPHITNVQLILALILTCRISRSEIGQTACEHVLNVRRYEHYSGSDS